MKNKIFSIWIMIFLFVFPVLSQESKKESGQLKASAIYEINQHFVDLAKKISPSVVTISTSTALRRIYRYDPYDYRGQTYRQKGLGSGVVVRSDGVILTNNHVIQDADQITVKFMNGKSYRAQVLGRDPKTDVAVLKIKAFNLQALKIGDSERLQVGELVFAVGSPLSENLAHSISHGIVSAKGRSNIGMLDYENFIQTDAAINPGNSGGPLINIYGELVGINTAILSRSGGSQGLGFAIPINLAASVMKQLLSQGRVSRGWLGVYIQDIDTTLAKAFKLPSNQAVVLPQVLKSGPAGLAGLQDGDIVVAMNQQGIKNANDFRNRIANEKPGTQIELLVLREGKRLEFRVKLGELPKRR